MFNRESKTIEFDDDNITNAADTPVADNNPMTLSEMLDQQAEGTSGPVEPVNPVNPSEPVEPAAPSDPDDAIMQSLKESLDPVARETYGHQEEQPSADTAQDTLAEAESQPEQDAESDAGPGIIHNLEMDDMMSEYMAKESTSQSSSYEQPYSSREVVTAPRYSNSFNRGDYKRREMDSRYVTKKFFAIMLVLAIVLSSAIGALIGGLVIGKGQGVIGGGAGSAQSLETATGSEMTIAQIIDNNDDSVVEITTKTQVMSMFGSTEAEGAGSGVIIREDGYIATNFHVIEGSNSVSVRLHDGTEHSAQVVGFDQQNDIAVLKIDGKDYDAADFGSSSELIVGDLAVAIGNPLGQLGGTATSGIISSLDRQLEIDGRTLNLLQTDSAINPGNSGGGLFNSKGQLIGIVVAKSSGTGIEGLGFAIPIDTAKPIIDDIVEHGKISTKPAAGIVIAEISEDQLAMYGVDVPGVYISEVNGENAKKAGLESGDRIVKFEGDEVKSSSGLVQAIQKHKVGDNVEFIVDRNGQQVSIRFELEPSSNFN